jgi:glutamine phosphoribosylpyrophosphate amidotransferase
LSATSSRAKSSSSTKTDLRSIKPFVPKDRLGFCIFEYVYFARPDSMLEGANVSAVRTAMGRELARLHPVEADLVIPVPDSGNYAALGFSEESGIPYDARLRPQPLRRAHLLESRPNSRANSA